LTASAFLCTIRKLYSPWILSMLTDHHREARRTAIVRLLRHAPVRRQQELVRLLKREGHAVTQSSVSRDLRELGVLKASEGYVLPDSAEISARTQDNFVTVAQFVREVRTAGTSITVVKTTIGSAGSVAAAIDKAGWEEVAGTVSGDDTIFIATADSRAQSRVLERLHEAFGV
jgi:transcriptional regulator of arginine metabolism